MNNELQLIFALRKNREDIKINQLPDVYIYERSSAKDVADWLRQKEFSENVVNKLEHVNGKDLFSLQLDTLIEYFGPKTGKRLDGMIIIQKKHCKVSLDIIYFLIFLSRFVSMYVGIDCVGLSEHLWLLFVIELNLSNLW